MMRSRGGRWRLDRSPLSLRTNAAAAVGFDGTTAPHMERRRHRGHDGGVVQRLRAGAHTAAARAEHGLQPLHLRK